MTQQVDSIIQCGTLLTVNEKNKVFNNHTIVVDEGKIIALTTIKQAQKKYKTDDWVDCSEQIVMPGFINAHTHAAMSLFKGLADDLPLMEWLEKHIWPAEAQHINEKFVKEGTELAIAEMLKSGTTCFNDMYFFPDIAAQVSEAIGIRAGIGLIVIEFPTCWAENADEYLQKAIELQDKYKGHNTIHTNLAPHAPYTVSDESFKRITTYENELQIPIFLHLHETEFEVVSAQKESGKRPLERMDELGIVSPALSAIHMTQLNDAEIKLLAEQNVDVVHCPHSNLKLASGFCPVDKLQKAGINVALGTDGAASNNNLDMMREMQTAALLAKGVAKDAKALSATNAIRMATINGAKALGIAQLTGSIEVGKSADIISIDLNQLASTPVYNYASQIVYACQSSQVRNSWVHGKMLMQNRKLQTINEQQVMQNAKTWQAQVQAK
jgi:5-methylthioadenosine/S-adenosylhomocysteine deaminase